MRLAREHSGKLQLVIGSDEGEIVIYVCRTVKLAKACVGISSRIPSSKLQGALIERFAQALEQPLELVWRIGSELTANRVRWANQHELFGL